MSDFSSIIHGRNGKISGTKAGAIIGGIGAIAAAALGQITWADAVAAVFASWQTYRLKVAVDNAAPDNSPAATPKPGA